MLCDKVTQTRPGMGVQWEKRDTRRGGGGDVGGMRQPNRGLSDGSAGWTAYLVHVSAHNLHLVDSIHCFLRGAFWVSSLELEHSLPSLPAGAFTEGRHSLRRSQVLFHTIVKRQDPYVPRNAGGPF